MWTLIWEARSGEGYGLSSGRRRDAQRVPPPELHGARFDPASTTCDQVRVYMHPGRMFVGEIEFDRAREQFDLTTAQLFGSFDEAEPACAVRRGFLLELCEASPAHHAAQTRVLFVGGLRPPR